MHAHQNETPGEGKWWWCVVCRSRAQKERNTTGQLLFLTVYVDKRKGVPVKLGPGTHPSTAKRLPHTRNRWNRPIKLFGAASSSTFTEPGGGVGTAGKCFAKEHASKQGTDQRPTCVWGLTPLRASAAVTASASPDSVMYRTPDELTRTPRGSPLPLRRREDLGVPSTPAAQVTPPVPCISLGRRPRLGLPVGKGRGVALACAMKRPTRDRSSHTTGSSGRRRG